MIQINSKFDFEGCECYLSPKFIWGMLKVERYKGAKMGRIRGPRSDHDVVIISIGYITTHLLLHVN